MKEFLIQRYRPDPTGPVIRPTLLRVDDDGRIIQTGGDDGVDHVRLDQGFVRLHVDDNIGVQGIHYRRYPGCSGWTLPRRNHRLATPG